MNHSTLKRIVFDQHEIIRNAHIVPRRYTLDPQANYVVTGLRRAGKSTLLYDMAQRLVAAGAAWERIIYINFEDERLADFATSDFQDIVLIQSELSEEKGYYFFDEIQNIPHWEKFVRRLADAGERVYVTGSNASMLSSQIASTLGGRFFTLHVTPYRFDEYLDANGQAYGNSALNTTREIGRISRHFDAFYQNGGFPESLRFASPREYVENVYQKVLLGDIAARNSVRNATALRVLMKKVAESVRSEISFSSLRNMLKSVGFSLSKDTVISYVAYAQQAYLLFSITNAAAKFVEREGNPKYYFSDNGLLGLFVVDRETALLENEIAVALHDRFGERLHYLKSEKTGVDIDFYLPDEGIAVQVAYSISGEARKREVANLVKLAKVDAATTRLVIVTKEEECDIKQDGVSIEVIPAWKFLLELAR
ncbi:MAG TPA: ATP-binding protein [Candidatus Aphodovivens excrementavium]|nr:ATP-binding protein [Candidatus Aphodovivens excrementavium]